MDAESYDVLNGILASRYSCRAYLDREVDRHVLEKIVESAQRTPSWCNTQPWQLLVTSKSQTERLRLTLGEAAESDVMQPDLPFPARYAGVFDQRRKECGWQLYESVGIAKGDRQASALQNRRNFDFFGAPHVAIVTTEEDLGVYGVLDCGAFVSVFMLVARSLGVASIAQAAIAGHSPVLRRHFCLPPNRLIVCSISFGYEDPAHPANNFRTRRAGTDDVIKYYR